MPSSRIKIHRDPSELDPEGFEVFLDFLGSLGRHLLCNINVDLHTTMRLRGLMLLVQTRLIRVALLVSLTLGSKGSLRVISDSSI